MSGDGEKGRVEVVGDQVGEMGRSSATVERVSGIDLSKKSGRLGYKV
jgi:hypothetical protein